MWHANGTNDHCKTFQNLLDGPHATTIIHRYSPPASGAFLTRFWASIPARTASAATGPARRAHLSAACRSVGCRQQLRAWQRPRRYAGRGPLNIERKPGRQAPGPLTSCAAQRRHGTGRITTSNRCGSAASQGSPAYGSVRQHFKPSPNKYAIKTTIYARISSNILELWHNQT